MFLSEHEAALVDGLAGHICAGRAGEAIDLTGLVDAFLHQKEAVLRELARRVDYLSDGNRTLQTIDHDLFTRRIRGVALYVALRNSELTDTETLEMIGSQTPTATIELLILGPYSPGVIPDSPRAVSA